MPVSCGLIRPSAATAVASVMTSPAPPTARAPRCTRCQSFGIPSTAEYWHIGDTHARLRKVVPRRVMGDRRRLTYDDKAGRSGGHSRFGSLGGRSYERLEAAAWRGRTTRG